uniref:C2H2-type domain-containing protein n=1 Tax=Pseudo-nitzschia australis TaxID=44445 RepID=A0A7S4EJW9_9STRA|mmetsp:Transcript_15007/g.31059  ORF Transcript_15007/g.31059 Transcript_15007/m.31059 type:complete len:572 (+) Transcript_15007:143-1858(+)
MTLIELGTADELKSFVENNAVGVVTFSAHWCGPCKASKPQLEQLAKECGGKVPVSIVHESDIGDYLHTFNVRAFPTYVLFFKGTEARRVEGVNLQGVKSMIEAYADKAGVSVSMPEVGGNTLGGSHTAAEARALRLAKLGGGGGSATTATATATDLVAPMETEDSKPAAAAAADAAISTDDGKDDVKDEDDAMTDATTDAVGKIATDKKNPVDDLDPEAIKSLTEEMGFSIIRAQKGLLYSSGKTLECAIEWLMEHQDDDDIDDPIPEIATGGAATATATGTAKATSYKCNECGKILVSMADLELHANKTGHSDFEESTQVVTPLTAEEKAAKLLHIKALLKAKRAEREQAEKVDHTEREKQRRFMGKEVAQTREQMETEQRKRDARERKREKLEQKRERERIRAELEKDKRERMVNKGKLKGRLGVDGYAPSAIQYAKNADENTDEPAAQRPKTGSNSASADKIVEYIGKVASYRAGGDGGKCLKILTLLVGNAADHPGEDKYKSINMETKTYKNKVKPFLGAKNILLAIGFGLPEKNNDGTHLVLAKDADIELLKATKVKLEEALVKYG